MKKTVAVILLLIVAGILFFYPSRNFFPFLSQADTGRDLYGFKVTAEGGKPYQDFWWVYGPLMPYAFALFFKVLGVSIQSALIGRISFILLAGLFYFLAVKRASDDIFAFASTLWFWAFGYFIFFTFNHVGGVAWALAAVAMLLGYVHSSNIKFIRWGFVFIFLLLLTKINFGLFALLWFTACWWGAERLFYASSAPPPGGRRFFSRPAFVLLLTAFVYGYFLKGLPFYYIRQCFPYWPSDHPINTSAWKTGLTLLRFSPAHIVSTPTNFLFGVLIILAAVNAIILFKKDRERNTPLAKTFFGAAAVLILAILFLHEYLASGITYRLHWATPFFMLFNFLLIAAGSSRLSHLIRYLLFTAIFLIAVWRMAEKHALIQGVKVPPQRLTYQTTDIYVANAPQWIETVVRTSSFLENRLKADEIFLAVPFDPLYYFLTGRKSPVAELALFEHIKITPQQEARILSDLKKENVRHIVITSRAYSPIPWLGIFGKDYGRLLFDYLQNDFRPVAAFGDWSQPPDKSWERHGTRIFERVSN